MFVSPRSRYPQTATQGTAAPRSEMTQAYAHGQQPPPTLSSPRSFPASSSASDLPRPHFLGAFFPRSRRETGASHRTSSTQGVSSASGPEETRFMKISGRKLERWQDPELASIHSISGRIYDRDGREIVRPVAGPSTQEDVVHDGEDDEHDSQMSSNDGLEADDGQYYYYDSPPTMPVGSSSTRS
ncbi:hypothetical protein V1517DRAFT_339909 [Lipomyces orientalis]|uniref:Uncharacterized protein n=1 Tax=Lipomyces orientalis TaxID=1233043 RepID=A0ACC3TL15_9ASCO